MSFMNISTYDYILLSQNGLFVLTLNMNVESKKFKDNENQIHMLHSMSSCDYLKLDPQNNILFECARDDRILKI